MQSLRISTRRHKLPRRGVALLLVMIGLVVCTILTAGFLSTQGTSIGIARNERDAVKARGIAQTGIDMCYWLIKNRSDWRTGMSPGAWLSNSAIGDGTVSVTVVDSAHASSFTADNTRAAVVTSTGTYNNRSFTLIASIQPTGGGTVFYNGNFVGGNMTVGNGDLVTAATVDSYNSSVAAYNALTPGSNANFVSDAFSSNSLLVYFPSIFRGSYTAGPTAPLASVVDLLGSLLGILPTGPSSVSTLTENRNAGTVVFPNTIGLTSYGAYTWSNQMSGKTLNNPGAYSSMTINGDTLNIGASGIYYITGDLAIGTGAGSNLTIADGVNAVFVVGGNLSLTNGTIVLQGAGQAAFYVNGNIAVSNSPINNGGTTSRLTFFGGSSGGNITIAGTPSAVYGSFYAPQDTFTMQSNAPKLFGAVCAQTVTLKNSSALHFDEALRNLHISNITGGSAAPGTADYRVSITGGPGIGH